MTQRTTYSLKHCDMRYQFLGLSFLLTQKDMFCWCDLSSWKYRWSVINLIVCYEKIVVFYFFLVLTGDDEKLVELYYYLYSCT